MEAVDAAVTRSRFDSGSAHGFRDLSERSGARLSSASMYQVVNVM